MSEEISAAEFYALLTPEEREGLHDLRRMSPGMVYLWGRRR